MSDEDPIVTLYQDTREQLPLPFNPDRVTVEVVTLTEFDYAPKGLRGICGFERKSMDDLAGSMGKGRENLEKEFIRGLPYKYKAIVIEGTPGRVWSHDYESNIEPKSIMSSLNAFSVRYGLHVIWAANPAGAVRYVEQLSRYCLEEYASLDDGGRPINGAKCALCRRIVDLSRFTRGPKWKERCPAMCGRKLLKKSEVDDDDKA